MDKNRLWFVHFIDDNSLDVEEMEFCTDNTHDNAEKALEEAISLCEDNGYEFVSADLLDLETGQYLRIMKASLDGMM